MAGKIPRLKILDFTYELPENRIAMFPAEPRDASRLLVYDNGVISHRVFHELPGIAGPDTRFVFNDTRVIPARLLFHLQTGAVIEIFLLKPLDPQWTTWEVMVGNRRKFRESMVLQGTEFRDNGKSGRLTIRWKNRDENQVELVPEGTLSVQELIELQGNIPLPPYIKRAAEASDSSRYQTVFAKNPGAVAAPTASLHFTPGVIEDLKRQGADTAFLTLHVGLGTFKPVTAEYANEHAMHAESFSVDAEFVNRLTRGRERRIIAVGTTSMRLLESLFYIGAAAYLGRPHPEFIAQDAGYDEELNAVETEQALQSLKVLIDENGGRLSGETAIFIMPGFRFRMTGGLITNFHQPGSTLLLLVAAFVGEGWRDIYKSALENGYRFLSYGDGSLILPQL